MKRKYSYIVFCLAFVMLLTCGASQAATSGKSGLATAEFPDVVKFDFKQVHENYEYAGTNVGKVLPIIEAALAKGEEAVAAGEKARANPTDNNKRLFVGAAMAFVRGAAESKTKIAKLWEEVRGIQSQTNILYVQGKAQTGKRIEELRKEFAREELKYKEIVARNKNRRAQGQLSEWDLRKMFEEEKRQAHLLSRLSDRIAFQGDFHKALVKASSESNGDFNLYEQFFGEATESFSEIGDLASNLPLIVERLQIKAALDARIPSRKTAAAGFKQIAQTRKLTKTIASQLMDICAGELASTTDGEEQVIIRQTETYKRWMEGETVDYRRPEKASD